MAAKVVPAAPRQGDKIIVRFRVPVGSGCGVRTVRRFVRMNGRRYYYNRQLGVGPCDALFGSQLVQIWLGRLRRGVYTVTGLPRGCLTFQVR